MFPTSALAKSNILAMSPKSATLVPKKELQCLCWLWFVGSRPTTCWKCFCNSWSGSPTWACSQWLILIKTGGTVSQLTKVLLFLLMPQHWVGVGWLLCSLQLTRWYLKNCEKRCGLHSYQHAPIPDTQRTETFEPGTPIAKHLARVGLKMKWGKGREEIDLNPPRGPWYVKQKKIMISRSVPPLANIWDCFHCHWPSNYKCGSPKIWRLVKG